MLCKLWQHYQIALLSTRNRIYLLCNSVRITTKFWKSTWLYLYRSFCNTSVFLSHSIFMPFLQSLNSAVGKATCRSHYVEMHSSTPLKIFFVASWKLMRFFCLNLGPLQVSLCCLIFKSQLSKCGPDLYW